MRVIHNASRKLARLPRRELLLVGALLLVTGCGMFEEKSAYEKLQDTRQRLIDLVADAGGTAKLEERTLAPGAGDPMDGWFINISGAELTAELLETIVEYAQKDAVFQLNLSNSSVTDEQLAQLDAGDVLQKCFILDLRDTAITDAGLDALSNFYVIRNLKLSGTKVTQGAVERLGDKQLAQKGVPEPLRIRPKTDI